MKFILSEEEIAKLKNKGIPERDMALEAARLKLLELSGFTCIYDEKENYGNYCDHCPVFRIWLDKPLSDNMVNMAQICKLDHNCSK